MLAYRIYDQLSFGPFTIYTAGLFLALAFLTGFLIALFEAKRKKINQNLIINLSIVILLAGFLGSRLGFIIQFPKYYLANPLQFFSIWQGGLAFYGGFLTALFFSWLYLRIKKGNFLRIADIFALVLPLGIFIGRIGCFLINDHKGIITSLPWGIVWSDGLARHPIAAYLSLAGLLIFIFLWFFRKKISKDGQLFILFLILYSVSIFLLDFLRQDPHYFGLSLNQWTSIIIFFVLLDKFHPLGDHPKGGKIQNCG